MKTDGKGIHFYKPTRSGSGAALQLNPSSNMNFIWLEISSQNKDNPQTFDWDNKIVFKLSEVDILKIVYIVSVIDDSAYKKYVAKKSNDADTFMNMFTNENGNLVELIHKNERTDSVSSMVIKPNSIKFGGGIRIFLNKKKDDKRVSHSISLTPFETHGMIRVLEKILDFPWRVNTQQ